MHDEQIRTEPAAAAESAPRRRLLLLAALALLVPIGIVGVYGLLRTLPDDCAGLQQGDPDPLPSRYIPFVGWNNPAPALAIVVSGQMHGYMLPCGCSDPQYGGLVRRHVFINQLKAKGWHVAAIDLGELAATEGIHRQRELKFQYSMKALDVMGYKAIGMGKSEMQMPLTDALVLYSAQQKVATPRPLASSLDQIDKPNQLYHGLGARRHEVFGGDAAGSPRIGVLSLTGPDLADSFRGDKTLKFLNNSVLELPPGQKTFPKTRAEMANFMTLAPWLQDVQSAFAKNKVDMAILMYHEYPNDPVIGGPAAPLKMETLRREMAEKCAESWEKLRRKNPAIPPLYLLLVLTETSEPRGILHTIPNTPTHLLEIGHKGKYVGVVGVFRKNGGLELKYELVLMEPKLNPPEGEKDAVIDVLEEYARQVKAENLLDKYIRSPHPIQVDPWVVKKYGGSQFVGSARCAKCHKKEWAIYSKTRHVNAYDTLVKKAKRPSLREFDPECIVCHTVGFRHPQGYNNLPPKEYADLTANKAPAAAVQAELAKHNAKLAHVGCENCHGPGSAHVADPDDAKVRALMNPYRPSKKEAAAVNRMKTHPVPTGRQEAAAEAKRLFDMRMQRLEDFCTKCHDEQNDVNWAKVPFLQKWAGGTAPIVHNDPDNVGNVWLPARNGPVQAGMPRKAE